MTRTIDAPTMTIDLLDERDALAAIRSRAESTEQPPLAVVSINLDHIHHFGAKGRWAGTIDRDRGLEATTETIDWLNLIDGAPIAKQAERLTGQSWPRLAGSDLAGPILDFAECAGLSVGFIGGMPETHAQLAERLTTERPTLRVSGYWAPSRDDLSNAETSGAIADEIRAADTDILIVGIGKPRQELWIAEYGVRTGARVLLAFGAVVDFLAGRVQRAPQWAARAGVEWAWRLMLEPRRLARRYLGQGPAAYREVRSWGSTAPVAKPSMLAPLQRRNASGPAGFTPLDQPAEVAVAIVGGSGDLAPLLGDLREQARELRMHVIAVGGDNAEAAREAGIASRTLDASAGFAAGVNAALGDLRGTEPVLVIHPGLRLAPGAIRALLRRMAATGAGIVVPRFADADGSTTESLHREPTVRRALGDALFGDRFPGRPRSLSVTDRDAESYRFAHPVEWATGAALLVHPQVIESAGRWDEAFALPSEQTDYFRRTRESGAEVWYEPSAVVRREQVATAASPQLDAQRAVTRVHYARKHMPRAHATAFSGASVLHGLLRSHRPGHRMAIRGILSSRSTPSRGR